MCVTISSAASTVRPGPVQKSCTAQSRGPAGPWMRSTAPSAISGGSVSADGAHLHLSVADAMGRVTGGHLAYGSTVRTTAELLLALLPGWQFGRAIDPATGYAELVPRRSSESA